MWILAALMSVWAGLSAALPVKGDGSEGHGGGVAATRGGVAASGPTSGEVSPGSRVVHTFDFEEKKLGNYETTPMHWRKVKDRGYPVYATGKLQTEVHRSAETGFEVSIDGGSVAYQYAPGKIVINPNADYYVLGFVKTTPMKYARAELAAWFADEKGNLIRESESHSARYATPAGGEKGGGKEGDGWQVLHLYMPGQNLKNARSLVLQMGLLQPQQLSNGALGKFELYHQDIAGTAWFDDIVVFQLPRLSVKCPAVPAVTGNIFGPGQKVELELTVSDLGREKLTAKLSLTDGEGKGVATEAWTFTADPNLPWEKRWTYGVLPPGLYTATLDVFDGTSLIARRRTRVVTLAAGKLYEKPATEFGVVATGWPVEAWNELPAVLRHMGVGLVQLPAWRKEMSEENLLKRDPQFDALINALGRLEIRVLANFSEMPTVLVEKLSEKGKGGAGGAGTGTRLVAGGSGDSVLSLVDADMGVWKPYVSFLLSRYANRVEYWQIGVQGEGSGGGGDRFYSNDARYPKLYGKIYGELAELLNQPQLVVPWNALYNFDPKQYPRAVLNLRLPSLIKPGQIPAYIGSFAEAEAGGVASTGVASTGAGSGTQPGGALKGAGAEGVIALVEPLEEGGYSRLDRLADFGQRVVWARSANPRTVLINLPLARRTMLGTMTSYTEPEELLIVYRTLAKSLGGATYKRELPLADGVRTFLFERDGAGVMVMWSEKSTPERLEVPLGAGPRMVDLLGNVTGLKVEASGMTGVTVSRMPIILDQVDARLVELRCSFGLADGTIPAGAGSVKNEVMLRNSYGEALKGALTLLPPKGWTVEPANFAIGLAGGAEFRGGITIRYPFAEYSGVKEMRGRLRTEAGAEVELRVPVTVTAVGVEMEGFSQMVMGGGEKEGEGELVVQQMITNISDAPLNVQAYVLVPGLARQQRFVLELRPGQTVIKRFTFGLSSMTGAKGDVVTAMKMLSGKTVAMGLRQSDGKTLVTKAIVLE